MSLTLKLTSLGIRTVAKPIGNLIKRQAREHDGFKRACVKFAQGLHRLDARMRLGLLEDSEAITRQIDREAASAEAKRLRSASRTSAPTVKTEAQMKADEEAKQLERRFIEEKVKNDEKKKGARLFKPLSESKAIDTGANFASEAFVFLIGVGLLLFENWRGRRKDATRREDVQERLEWLEERVKTTQGEKGDLQLQVGSLMEELERLKNSSTSTPPQARASGVTASSLPGTEEKVNVKRDQDDKDSASARKGEQDAVTKGEGSKS